MKANITLEKTLKRTRKEYGLSQSELGRMLDLAQMHISLVEQVLAAVRTPAKIDGWEIIQGVVRTYLCVTLSRRTRKGCLRTPLEQSSVSA